MGLYLFMCVCLPLQADCNNYIRLLEFLGDGRIYVCGTYAFDPQCAFLVGLEVVQVDLTITIIFNKMCSPSG